MYLLCAMCCISIDYTNVLCSRCAQDHHMFSGCLLRCETKASLLHITLVVYVCLLL